MLVNDNELKARLQNPLNLMNRLGAASSSRKNAMSLFIPSNKEHIVDVFKKFKENGKQPASVVVTPEVLPAEDHNKITLDKLVDSSEDKISLALAHDESLKVLNRAVSMLGMKLDDIKPEKLPAVILSTQKVVESIRRERLDRDKAKTDESVHFHFYKPDFRKIETYDVVHVTS